VLKRNPRARPAGAASAPMANIIMPLFVESLLERIATA
jgi:hypothetical protein